MRQALLFAAMLPLLAQNGRVRVVVTDPTNAGVAKAEVSLACAGGAAQKARTGDDGAAPFAGLPSGNCQITAAAPGFKTWNGSYTVGGSEEGRVNVPLAVTLPGTNVDVNAKRPQTPVKRFMNWLTSCTRR